MDCNSKILSNKNSRLFFLFLFMVVIGCGPYYKNKFRIAKIEFSLVDSIPMEEKAGCVLFQKFTPSYNTKTSGIRIKMIKEYYTDSSNHGFRSSSAEPGLGGIQPIDSIQNMELKVGNLNITDEFTGWNKSKSIYQTQNYRDSDIVEAFGKDTVYCSCGDQYFFENTDSFKTQFNTNTGEAGGGHMMFNKSFYFLIPKKTLLNYLKKYSYLILTFKTGKINIADTLYAGK